MKRLLSITLLALLIPVGMRAQGTLTVNGTDATNPDALQKTFGETVTFDAATNTLTLSYLGTANTPFVASTNFVVSSLPDLKIKIKGENYIQLPEIYSVFKTESVANKITFVTDDPESALLSIPSASRFSGDGVIEYSDDLVGTENQSTGYFTIEVPETEYGISVGSIPITKKNRKTFWDRMITFDGQKTLVLRDGVELSDITIDSQNLLSDGLVVYLDGAVTIENSTYAISSGSQMPITFTTNPDTPGSLTYIERTCTLTVANSAFNGFESIAYKNGLVAKLDYTQEEVNANNTDLNYDDPNFIAFQTVTVSVPIVAAELEPIVNEKQKEATNNGENGVGLGADIEDSPTDTHVVKNGILYELGGNDGYDEDGSSKVVQLNTQVTPSSGAEPGGESFKGTVFRVPAGSGRITVTVKTSGEGVLNVQVGKNEPRQFSGLDDYEDCGLDYAVQEATNVYIYNSAPEVAPATSRHRAPGKKMPNTIGIKSVSVSARRVASAPPPSMSPKALTKAMVAAAKEENHIAVSDKDVTSIASDAFDGQSDITYVDLSGTSITGVEIAATKYELGDATVLLLPAGNTTAVDTKNVVIGGVCEDLLLDDSKNFEIPSDFTAVKVAQKREYTADKNSTVCLPYALDETQASALGTFYEPTAIESGTVTMSSVTKTKANVPYMLKAKGTKVSAEMVEVKKPTGALAGTETRFVGTYSGTTLSHTDTKQYYCFTTDGTFIHVKTDDVHVKPFRAYIALDAALGRSLDIDFGDGTTGIKNLKVGVENNVYYDLQGRRVLYPKKGIYILNGKKVIIK
ncbi:MAG: hypothetical protein IJ540_01990 [Prevotella sp.]|nr:hypothetical protein [Prevotella sp.]